MLKEKQFTDHGTVETTFDFNYADLYEKMEDMANLEARELHKQKRPSVKMLRQEWGRLRDTEK
jgi:hypothetical protein